MSYFISIFKISTLTHQKVNHCHVPNHTGNVKGGDATLATTSVMEFKRCCIDRTHPVKDVHVGPMLHQELRRLHRTPRNSDVEESETTAAMLQTQRVSNESMCSIQQLTSALSSLSLVSGERLSRTARVASRFRSLPQRALRR